MNTTPTTSPASAAIPALRSIELEVEGRSGKILAHDWLSADRELRTAAMGVSSPDAFTKVRAEVTWHDGVIGHVGWNVHQGDEIISENLLVRVFRSNGLSYTNQTQPVGETSSSWQEMLRHTFGDMYPILVSKWSRILARLPERTEHVAPVEQTDWHQVPPGADEGDHWGGEDPVAITMPIGAATAANDAPSLLVVARKPNEHTPPPAFVGSKYVAGRDKVETAKLMRAELKELGAKGTNDVPKGTTFRVNVDRYSMGSSIEVYVIPPPGFVVLSVARLMVDLGLEKEGESTPSYFTDRAVALLDAVKDVRMSYNRDGSDSQTDYHDVHFSGDARIDSDFMTAQRTVMTETLRAVFPNAKRWPA